MGHAMNRQFGIIFDVDGIIADSEAVNLRATATAFRDILGIQSVSAADFRESIGRGAEAYVRVGAAAHGHALSPEQVSVLVAKRQENFLDILRHENLPAFPGVLELIASASVDKRFGLAIATSSTREKSQAVLVSAGIPYLQMDYVCGDDVTRKKPDPELFQIACHRLGLPPACCAVIEDAPNGIAAANAAGCKSIAVTNTCPAEELQSANLVVDSLSEVSLETILDLLTRHS
jgi:HAD superfamily hydrolase (TIGR01509 family)